MKVTSVEFVKSVVNVAHVPKDGLREIAFAGRSNVGKSSLINCLLNRKKLAKTSSTPGKTRQLNYYRINGLFYFVDLPGYGYAKVSKQEKRRWQNLIETYLQNSTGISGVIAIVDSRVGATNLDLELLGWLSHLDVKTVVVATKADKLSKNQMLKKLSELSEQIKDSTDVIIPFSAIKGTGKKDVWREIITLME
jgi:GTP-binding protein